jgi:iron complex outermembrane receptor protein
VTSAVSLDAAIFYSDISNLVQSVPIVYQGENLNQSQNVGDGEFYGVEFSATVVANDWLTLGGNYTFTHRHIADEAGLPVQPTGVPTHKAFLYAQAQAMEKLTITPSVEIASSRWTSTSDGSLYYKTGSFALLGVKAAYAITDQVEVAAGVRNLLDENYQLTDGFPEAGRSYYLTTHLTF